MSRMLVFALLLSVLVIEGINGFSVSGNKILDSTGKQVFLRGVDRPSFEWSATGQYASLADYTLMKSWGANVVRVSLNQDFWLSGANTYSANYSNVIKQQVTWITSLGMAVILDLHWSDQGNLANGGAQQCMADTDSVTFWTQVATTFGSNQNVLFELYNEPYVTDWGIWLSGGSSCGFTVKGMQQLYNAVRATGATNVVICGGINYAFDLSGVATHAVVGTNIAYATHPYDYTGKDSSTWDNAFGYLTATYPVIATEFGQYCNSDNYVQTLLTYMQNKGMHWSAWAWWVDTSDAQPCDFPSIIADWNGTPYGTVGPLVKAALLAGPGTTSGSATTATTAKSATTTAATTTTAKAATTTTGTTAKPATTTTGGSTTGSGSNSGTITVVVNSGTSVWWIAINSFSGAVYTAQSGTQTITIKDSSSGATWQTATVETWGWEWSPSAELVVPISVKLTTTAGKSAILTNVITSVNGGGTYSGTATYA